MIEPVDISVPAGMPVLAAGRHAGPELGGCLMEVVSVLAGEPWSDRPRCTHAALAEVARLVNDGSSEHGRSALLPLAAELTGAGGRDGRVAPSLVVLAVEYAGREGHANRKGQAGWSARRDLARARRRLRALDAGGPRAGLHRLTDPLYRRGPGQRALARAATSISRGTPPRRAGSAPDVAADARLRALLERSLRVTRELLGHPHTGHPHTGHPHTGHDQPLNAWFARPR